MATPSPEMVAVRVASLKVDGLALLPESLANPFAPTESLYPLRLGMRRIVTKTDFVAMMVTRLMVMVAVPTVRLLSLAISALNLIDHAAEIPEICSPLSSELAPEESH